MSIGEQDVVLVRHGSTEWAEQRKHTGRTDVPLTATGEDEARALYDPLALLAAGHPVHAFSSPLQRASTTHRLSAAEYPAVLDDDLAEFDYGDYEGLTSAQIRISRPGWDIFRDGCPNGESPADVSARCDRFAARIAGLNGVVFVFTHGHLSRFLTARLLGLPGEQGRVLWNNTGSVGIVRTDDRGTVLLGWNYQPSGFTRPSS
jgi:broad specificity phosphatase PhoE